MGDAVRRYIDILIIIITFPYSTCISSFFGSSIPICLFILKMFFFLVYVIFVQYQTLLKEHSRSFKNRDHANIINYIAKNVERTSTVFAHESPKTSTCEVPRDISRTLQPTLCAIMAS